VDGRGELVEIAREARTLLERERRRGRRRIVLAGVGARDAPTVPAGNIPTPSTVEVLSLPGFEPPAPAAPRPPLAATLSLRSDLPQEHESLRVLVSGCRLCGLCETRTQTVFADGSPAARLMFVGEAPGRDEDEQGLPFVGRAGQLLNKMIAAIELAREDVYICNVLKCRPPENRTPAPEEVERCIPYLEQQIAIVKPALICALGLSAAQALLATKASMASMRGRTYAFRGIPLIPTYHPAALLRNPSLKREAWVDLQRVRDLLLAGSPA
jgi:DNA polymerase